MSRGRSGQGDQFNSPQAAHFGHPFVCPRLLPSNALLLAAPGPQDSAQFECVVNNEVGESRRRYQVTVLGESGRGGKCGHNTLLQEALWGLTSYQFSVIRVWHSF